MWIKNAEWQARQPSFPRRACPERRPGRESSLRGTPWIPAYAGMTAAALAAFLFVGSASAQPRPSQSFEYDAVGNLTRSTDALNRSTQFTWDALGRPRLTTQPAPASGVARPTIRTDHNPAGDLTRVTDPRGLATTYSVTGLGEVTSLVSPDTGTTVSTFDVAGNLKTSRDARGQTTTYTYDALNRPSRAQYGDGSATSFFYDEGGGASIGQLTRIVDPGSLTTTFTYDLHGRVLTRTQTVLNGTTPLTQTLTHTYTPGTGQRNKTVYPSGAVLSISYHPNTKQVQSVSLDGTVVAGALQWHALSAFPKSLRLANGQTWSSALDLEGRVKSYALGGATVSLTWDAAHRLTQITNGTPSQNQSFAYDGLGRLTAFTSGARAQSFTYDASGNVTSKFDKVGANAGSTDTFTIAASSNRMTQISNLGVGFGYDAAGNRTSTSNISHSYNAKGRLVKTVITSGGTSKTLNFLYNALEQRVRKTGASGFTAYVYDDAGQLIGEYDNLGRATREYVWLPSPDGKPNNPSYRPIAIVTYTYAGTNTTPTSKAIFAIEADHLGAPRRVSSASNQTRWTWTPAPFGDTLPNENPSALGKFTLNLRFPGQYFDPETNLAYNHHRDYEATTGRYIQSDPIGLQGGINTYAYVGGNPLKYSDPQGLFVPAAIPLIEAGAALLARQAIARAAATAAAEQVTARAVAAAAVATGGAATTIPGSSSPTDNNDCCKPLYEKISARVDELKKRYSDLIRNPRGLPPSGPMSIGGHQQQFINKQTNLRDLLNEADAMGCKAYRSDAWAWATTPAPLPGWGGTKP